jgi:hypothetical protein
LSPSPFADESCHRGALFVFAESPKNASFAFELATPPLSIRSVSAKRLRNSAKG